MLLPLRFLRWGKLATVAIMRIPSRVCAHVPKSIALTWLTKGLPSEAVVARDLIAFDELAPFRRVWLPDRSPLICGSAPEILNTLR